MSSYIGADGTKSNLLMFPAGGSVNPASHETVTQGLHFLKMEGNDENAFVQMANSGILEVLKETAFNAAIQGELMGPGIQGNREGFTEFRWFVFDVWDIGSGRKE